MNVLLLNIYKIFNPFSEINPVKLENPAEQPIGRLRVNYTISIISNKALLAFNPLPHKPLNFYNLEFIYSNQKSIYERKPNYVRDFIY